MNNHQSMSFWRSFYLNIFLVVSTLTLGTVSSLAERESSFQESKITVKKLSLTSDPETLRVELPLRVELRKRKRKRVSRAREVVRTPSDSVLLTKFAHGGNPHNALPWEPAPRTGLGMLSQRSARLTTQNQPNSKQNTSRDSEEEPLDFSDTGRSGQQTAGETRRGQCPDVSFPLTALVPSSNSGKTIATHPKLWFYVPYSTEDISKIEFVIQDANRNDVSRQTWQPQNIPGYLSTSLPETEPALETSKSYRWYFKVYCQQDGNSVPLFVQGWIEKSEVSEDLSQQLKEEKSPHMLYAYNDLWFDAINSLLDYYLIAPSNSQIRTDWEKLIKAKGADLELPELETTDLFVRQN